MQEFSLEGRVAIITGSSRGIGKSIAELLARRGAKVVINSSMSVEAGEATAAGINEGGAEAIYVQADVADYESAARLVARCVDRFGAVDIVVNNADWFTVEPFEKNTPAYWDRVIGVGMYAAIHVTHAALPFLKKSHEARILTIAGDSGRVGLAMGVAHAGAMAALIAMTKSWAQEFVPYGIRANAVSPGPIATDMWKATEQAGGGELLQKMNVHSPLGIGQPDDIAQSIAFLASPAARHITGQTLSVNGGRCFPS